MATLSCNLGLSSSNQQVETDAAGTLVAMQNATELAAELGTQIAATVRGEDAPTPTDTLAPTESPTATPHETATPKLTPTPTPTGTATATSTPAPVQVAFAGATSGGGSVSGRHTGAFGIVFADATYGYNPGNGRIQVSAWIPLGGSFENPRATGWLQTSFTVPSSLGSSLELQVSGAVDWKGVLAGNGVAGAGAEVTIVLKLLEGSRVVTQTLVHSKEVREAALSLGGLTDADSTFPSLSATVVAGREYTLRLEATCEATSGVISASTHCVFGPSDFYEDGYVHWGGFTALMIP